MFHEMRREKQALNPDQCAVVLRRGTSGVLALSDREDYPYALPISYVFDGEKLYFHSAVTGHKLEVIRKNPKASFCVIDQDDIVPEKFTTYFRSVIAFGTIRILQEEEEKRLAIEKLAEKYSPKETVESREKEIRSEWPRLCMLEMTIDHLTGKEAIELVRASAARERK